MLRLGIIVSAVAVFAAPVLAQQGPSVPSITVTGEASATIVPDTAILSLGIVSDRPRAADAAADNGKALQAVIEAIEAEGVEPRNIETLSASLSPVFDQSAQGRAKITGFRASNELQIRVKPVDKAGTLAGKLIDKGVNSIDGVQFTSSDDAMLSDRLRADAAKDARHKAEIYVGSLGAKLGRVLRIDSSAGGFSRDSFFVRGAAQLQRAATPVPLEAGQQTARDSVSVTWELVQ